MIKMNDPGLMEEALELESEIDSEFSVENGTEPHSTQLLKSVDMEENVLSSIHENFNGKFALPPRASFLQQFKAMLYRQWFIKRRGYIQTALEIISPMLMMTLLVIGWSQSEVLHYDAEIYSNNSFPMLEKFLNIFDDPTQFVENCLASHSPLMNHELTTKRLQNQNQNQIKPTTKSNSFPIPNFINPDDIKNFIANNSELQNAFNDIASKAGIDPDEFSNFDFSSFIINCANVTSEAVDLIQELFQFNGYLPIPSFDGFVSVHKFLNKALGDNENEELKKKEKEQQRQQQRQEPKLMGMADLMGNLIHLGKLYFSPNDKNVLQLIDHLNHTHTYFGEYFGGVYASEEEGVEAIVTDNDHIVWGLIVINELDMEKGKIDYVIRMNYTSVPRTYMKIHRFVRGLAPAYKNYFSSGFLTLQKMMNEYVFSSMPSSSFSPYPVIPVWTLPFPTPEYNHNRFYDAIGPLMGLIMCLSTLYPLGMLVKVLVEEKETKTKEIMQIMGLRPFIFSLSWLITYFIIFFMASFLVTCLLSITFLQHSDFSLIFVIFFLFSLSLIPFGFVISTFFSKAKIASFVSPFLHFSALMPRYIFFQSSSNQAITLKTLFSLLPPTAFTFGVDLIGQYEGSGEGIHWKNIYDDDFSLASILNILILDFFLYFFLAWYLEKVIPSEFGPNLPPWFVFTQSYWFGKSRTDKWFMYDGSYTSLNKSNLENENENGNLFQSKNHSIDFQPFDPKSDGSCAAVQIENLQKIYPGGKTAVRGLTLDIYEGQITALLGQNGAGKSTSISMLTGLIKPSNGDAKVWGRSILSDMDSARRVIGICPQQNVLFPHLTVFDHLKLFAALKGMKEGDVHEASMAMISRVGLKEKLHSFPHALSGGMKRKLQVAIAMIGGSRVVFLDEPTSGMDPHARRAMWKLLRSFKKGRAIILTTHYMDEADLLCDRIAILKEGKLRCNGSSLFLKGRYGAGYTLTMTKTTPSSPSPSSITSPSASSFNDESIQNLICSHVSDAEVIRSAAGEVTFRLPLSQKSHFTQLFSDLEQNQRTLGVAGFGVSMTSLEDVFFQLANEDDLSPSYTPPSIPTATVTSITSPPIPSNYANESDKNENEGLNEVSFSQAMVKENGVENDADIENDVGFASDHSSHSEEYSHGRMEEDTVKLTSITREETLSFKPWIPSLHGHDKNSPFTQPLLVKTENFVDSIKNSNSNSNSNSKTMKSESAKLSKGKREEKKGLGDLEMGEAKTKKNELALDDSFYGVRSFKRSWIEMFKKRYIVGVRDIKGLINAILLPVFVIAFVLLILTIQVNPAGPAMKLDFDLFDPSTSQVKSSQTPNDEVQVSEIPIAGMDPSSLLSLQRSFFEIIEYGNMETSYDMSEYLLHSIPFLTPRYNALIYNDTIFQQYNFTSLYLTLSHPPNVSNSSISEYDFPPLNPDNLNTSAFNGSDFNKSAAEDSVFTVKDSIKDFFLKFHTSSGMGLISPLTIMHNTSSDHALPSMIQELSNAYFKSTFKDKDASFHLQNHPLPISVKEAKRIETVLSMLASLFILIPFCYLSATFAVFIVKERTVKAKHLQLVSGANIYAYWSATYIWDLLNYILIILVTMVVFYAYHDDAFVSTWTKSMAVFFLLFSFGLSVIPLSYCYSFFFNNHANAQVAIAGIHFLSGFITVVASIIMEADNDTRELNQYFIFFYRFFPPFNFGDGLIKLSAIDLKSKLIGVYENPFDWHVVGRPICLMLLESFFFFFLAIAMDLDLFFYSFKWMKKRISFLFKSKHPYWAFEDCYYDGMVTEDSAVANERKRVENDEANSDAIVIKKLRKVYACDKNNHFLPKTAVVDLSLAIPKGQCFGFLGVNGAGKSTTLSILTGDSRPTSGNAWINHWSVVDELSQVQRHIGYCPQFDPLIDLMTAKEHLQMYARLKGIDEDEIDATVSETISAVGLDKFADVCACNYSGGNKRKLSLAIALVGKPAAVFLDEPSSGMDPQARRSMWKIILDTTSNRCTSVVLTTHSMEECEALCSRVGMMCAGRLVCLGSPQDLKSRFGDGYHLELHVKGGGQVEKVKAFVEEAFKGAVLEEEHLGRLRFNLPLEGSSLSRVFGTIEKIQTPLHIDDYSISQCSLEQVFLTFAQSQAKQSHEVVQ